jgi:hypothetical protein
MPLDRALLGLLQDRHAGQFGFIVGWFFHTYAHTRRIETPLCLENEIAHADR